jgi:hypothetical protein
MNAVLKPQHIETIFDYQLNEQELLMLACGMSYQEYIESATQHDINNGLASLFGIRGNRELSKKYMDKLDRNFVQTHITWDSTNLTAH